ncbi:forkhead box protein B1 [Hydra vulgaris]|uniref:forkhead box protein B1 n=1 Tax=Hydra vulgaris TaxID=6087 RepID=UPI0002B4D80B|nr:forkhead box protein B1 [Hydra vulgaris]
MPRPRKSSYEVDKPPYSYVALCAMAIHSSPYQMMTLSDIYKYIMNKFPFYRKNNKKWQNSLRHNLSFNDCFVKISKTSKPGGKGNYWTMHKDCFEMFNEGSFLRRKKRFTLYEDDYIANVVNKVSSSRDGTERLFSKSSTNMKEPSQRWKSFNIEDILDLKKNQQNKSDYCINDYYTNNEQLIKEYSNQTFSRLCVYPKFFGPSLPILCYKCPLNSPTNLVSLRSSQDLERVRN